MHFHNSRSLSHRPGRCKIHYREPVPSCNTVCQCTFVPKDTGCRRPRNPRCLLRDRCNDHYTRSNPAGMFPPLSKEEPLQVMLRREGQELRDWQEAAGMQVTVNCIPISGQLPRCIRSGYRERYRERYFLPSFFTILFTNKSGRRVCGLQTEVNNRRRFRSRLRDRDPSTLRKRLLQVLHSKGGKTLQTITRSQ